MGTVPQGPAEGTEVRSQMLLLSLWEDPKRGPLTAPRNSAMVSSADVVMSPTHSCMHAHMHAYAHTHVQKASVTFLSQSFGPELPCVPKIFSDFFGETSLILLSRQGLGLGGQGEQQRLGGGGGGECVRWGGRLD